MKKNINKPRRKQLQDMGKALLAFAAVTLAPSIARAKDLTFAPKGGGPRTLVLSEDGGCW